VHFAGGESAADHAAPTLGQHTAAILGALGKTDAEIRELQDKKVV
jgi:crotonobetainyl-CoA:carnitine CoA-transferase CaiB-like acyl-CoA transferase